MKISDLDVASCTLDLFLDGIDGLHKLLGQ